MSEHIWDKQPAEPDEWFIRFTTFLHLGTNRSYIDAYRQHVKVSRSRKGTKPNHISPQWHKAIHEWDWEKRAQEYDKHLNKLRIQEEEEQRRQQIMNTSYARTELRVLALMGFAKDLSDALKREKKFNPAMMAQWRGLLDDIAKETGGRVRKNEVTGANGGPLEVQLFLPEQEQDKAEDADGGEEWQ